MICASIDTETLGLDPDRCDIVEFGCVLDDLSNLKPLSELPVFHCYFTKPDNIYQGEVHAMYMYSKSDIFRRISERESGYLYMSREDFSKKFSDWVFLQTGERRITVVGKNYANFDGRFLRRCGLENDVKIHHRILDVGSMYFDPLLDECPPSLDLCLERAKINKSVSHTAVEDALDVLRCVRAIKFKGISEELL